LREPLEKIFGQFGLEIADAFCGDFRLEDAERSAAKIDRGSGKSFVHRHQKISGAQDATF